jgi:F-type H+-transporting ATPase subunit gamma
LLPLDAPWQKGLAKVPWPTKLLPEVMCRGDATLRALIREYLFISIFRACAESLASENASRLAAMERADKNIDDLLESLHTTFHRIRQAGIDEELFDVIAGFEALSTGKPLRNPPVTATNGKTKPAAYPQNYEIQTTANLCR